MTSYIVVALILWNIIVFAMYGIDKKRSKSGMWRISEKALIISAVFMGGLGALLAMKIFRHKTKHLEFKLGIPLIFIFNILVLVGCYYFGLL